MKINYSVILRVALVIHIAPWVAPTFASSCLLQQHKAGLAGMSIPAPGQWSKTGEHLFGASTLYHIDDDAFWHSPRSILGLREARITTLRYPGGEMADNYDWEKHALERPDDWPKEGATEAEREARTDYREFLAHAAVAGVQELFFVVNVDGAFRASGNRENNLKRYAEKAARWVKAVKEAGGRVKFWEIGNEPYLPEYPLTAEEYAQALNVFAREMRAADPSILIGAAGPGEVGGVGFGDRLDRETLEKLRVYGWRQTCRGMSRDQCNKKLIAENASSIRPAAWWATLIAQAKDSFDFAVVHRYYRVDLANEGKVPGFRISNRLRSLKRYLWQATGRPVLLALTEWNTPNERRHGALTEIDHLLNIAIQLGNNASGGVDYAHYWPLRLPNGAFKPLLMHDGSTTAVGKLFGLLGGVLNGVEASESIVADRVYVLQFRGSGQRGYVVVNVGSDDVQIKVEDVAFRQIWVDRIRGGPDGKVLPSVVCGEKIPDSVARWLEVPGESVVVLRILQ